MLPQVQVSSATVRNVMGDLEALGLVSSPHTSAGKVPTHLGLRFFVDTLLSVEPWQQDQVEELQSELNPTDAERAAGDARTCSRSLPR